MKLLYALMDLISSFFKHNTQAKKEEIALSDATSKAIVEEIRATENAVVVQQIQDTQEAVSRVRIKHKKVAAKQKELTIDEQIDEQFGSDE